MAAGLFGQRSLLYPLTRHSEGEETEWSLFRIDPEEHIAKL